MIRLEQLGEVVETHPLLKNEQECAAEGALARRDFFPPPETKAVALRQVDGFLEECPPPAERMRYAAAVWFPPQLVLRKEWGECLIRLGIVGGALSMFEELELWDNLILCYRMLDKPAAAMEVVRYERPPRRDANRGGSLGMLTVIPL